MMIVVPDFVQDFTFQATYLFIVTLQTRSLP